MKIVFFGEAKVGKSSLISQYARNEFSENYLATLSYSLDSKNTQHDFKDLKVRLIDVAGNKTYTNKIPELALTRFGQTHVVALVFDVTDKESFDNLDDWREVVVDYGDGAKVILVANKSDMEDDRKVSVDEAKAYAKKHNFTYFETCASDEESVKNFFNAAIDLHFNKFEKNISVDESDHELDEEPDVLPAQSNVKTTFMLLGETGVGKTTIVNRYVKDQGTVVHEPTIAADFSRKKLEVDGKETSLILWDCAGSERFRSNNETIITKSQLSFLVYDITDRSSFEKLEMQRSHVAEISEQMQFILVGNKQDLAAERKVTKDEAEKYVNEHGLAFYIETSGKENMNIDALFSRAVRVVQNMPIKEDSESQGDSHVDKSVEGADHNSASSEGSELEEEASKKKRWFGKTSFEKMNSYTETLSKLKPKDNSKNDNPAGKRKADYLEQKFYGEHRPTLEQIESMLKNNPKNILDNRSKWWGPGLFKLGSLISGNKRNEFLDDRLAESKTERMLIDCLSEMKHGS